jgi:peptidoglycan/xylan/chitin deacetylase (PgdA/CDA1 family)
MKPVQTIAEFQGRPTPVGRLRATARRAALLGLSLLPGRGRRGALRFPYYHHVFTDEQAGFARQLRWMRRHGEFLGWDDAIALMHSGQPIDGRYFCLSFDDGFKSCATHALPILSEQGASAAFFVATRFVGTDPVRDRDMLLEFYPGERRLMEFMTWDDCRTLRDAGMVVGSHTHGHARLSALEEAGVIAELTASKQRIETELGGACSHFCCPWGQPDSTFLPERDPDIARRVGYASFATTVRGPTRSGDSPFFIRRDHTLANDPDFQLRAFLLERG